MSTSRGNYSIIMIIVIILSAIIDIMYFSLTSDNQNRHNNRDSQANMYIFNVHCIFTILLTIPDVFSVFHYKS